MVLSIFKMIATSGCLTAFERDKFVEGAYSGPPDPLAGLRGPASKGTVGREKERESGGERKRRREGKGRGEIGPLAKILGSAPAVIMGR